MRLNHLQISLLLLASLSACVIGRQPEPTASPTETAIPSPTAVPTPSLPLAILVVPADMDPTASDAYQKTVYELAQQSSMRFQVRNTLSPEDLEPALRIVIALPPDPGIVALAAAAPQAQFLAINIPGINAGGNVSVLASTGAIDTPAFVAGYAAAMISDDFRAGMILPKDDAGAQQAATAFANGMAYYCGLCTSFRLYTDQNGGALSFPQFVAIPADEDPRQFGGLGKLRRGQPEDHRPVLVSRPEVNGQATLRSAWPNRRADHWGLPSGPQARWLGDGHPTRRAQGHSGGLARAGRQSGGHERAFASGSWGR